MSSKAQFMTLNRAAHTRILPVVAAAFGLAFVSRLRLGLGLTFEEWTLAVMAALIAMLWAGALSRRVPLAILDHGLLAILAAFFLSRVTYLAWFAPAPNWWDIVSFALYLPVFLSLVFWASPRQRAWRISWVFLVAFFVAGTPLLAQLAMSSDPESRITAYVYLHIPLAAGIMVLLLRAYGEKEAIHQSNTAAAERQARLDPLTDLANRRGLAERVRLCMEAHRRHGTPFSLIVMDLDGFKQVNDTYGHAYGDRLLVDIADILRRTARILDHPGRLGGDEFAILLPHTAPAEGAILAERVREEIQIASFPNGVSLTASFGVASFRTEEESHHLFARADDALYDAKRAGGNRVRSQDSDAFAGDRVPRGERPTPPVKA